MDKEIISPSGERNRAISYFHEQNRLAAAVFASLALHVFIAASLALFSREAPATLPRFDTQIISVALDTENFPASPIREQSRDFSSREKTKGHEGGREPLLNHGVDAGTKNNERSSRLPREENTNPAHDSETAYAIALPSHSATRENILAEDQQGITTDSPSQTPPRYLKTPKPPYPFSARLKGHDGVVFLRVEVLKNGRVGHISVRKSSGYDILDKAALDTVAKWQFEPGRNRQEIQDMIIDIPVRFSLH